MQVGPSGVEESGAMNKRSSVQVSCGLDPHQHLKIICILLEHYSRVMNYRKGEGTLIMGIEWNILIVFLKWKGVVIKRAERISWEIV